MRAMSLHDQLADVARRNGILVLYLFGSRAADGERLLRGETVSGEGSDLDVGVVLAQPARDPFLEYGGLYADLIEVFHPLRADVVLLHEANAFLQEAAVRGREVFCADEHRRDLYELEVLRRAGELIPIQRRLEMELYGKTSR